jgi:hypothetical protein
MSITLSAEDIKRCQMISDRELGIVRQIAVQVAEATDVPFKAIMGVRRDARTVQARQLVMYIARREGLSLQRIGYAMSRDHTTVLHGIRAEEQRRSLLISSDADKINVPGGATNANPGTDHRQSEKETARMADQAIIPIPGQNAITQVSPL